MNRWIGLALGLALLAGCTDDPAIPDRPVLSDARATPETRILYDRLAALSHDHVLIGHHESTAYGVGWWLEDGRSDVSSICGDMPAVIGWDLAYPRRATTINGVPFTDVQRLMRDHYDAGGVNTVCWHAANPVHESDSWDVTPAVHRILPGGDLHARYRTTLDALADRLLDLRGSDGRPIPVLFRPFHEMNGSWFWWGADHVEPADFKALWRFTRHHLEARGVHHLIWVYSPDSFSSRADYLRTWPGDAYVDVVGVDDYTAVLHSAAAVERQLQLLVEIARSHNKLAAVTETGQEGVADVTLHTGHLLNGLRRVGGIAWVMSWRNQDAVHHFIPFPDHPAADDYRTFCSDPAMMLRSDLPEMYE